MSAEASSLTTRAETYRNYPPELKAEVVTAIENNGCNVAATAKLFCLPEDTVRYWWHNSERFRKVQGASGPNLADKLELIAHQQADSIASHDLSLVTLADKARSLGIIIDRMQLLRGQPTSINANINVDVTDWLSESIADVIDVTPE